MCVCVCVYVCERHREGDSVCEGFHLYPWPQQWGGAVLGKNNPVRWVGEGGVSGGTNAVRRERAEQVTLGCPAPLTS